ncbi:MAG: hypothetical protein H6818_09030 [Phycisphaerales bacterium]|nr:hypothetical protein [Phycisphaerales bacterium]MCB9862713.1 hypothetical protein [Phycisphaerales bacterium]
MIFIWGWGYFFRRNILHIVDTCSHCHRHGPLACYDAIYFFKLYYLPMIPLGRKRIMRECPHCKYGSTIPYSKYRKIVAGELEPAIETLRDKPSDRDSAVKALAITIQLCDKQGFERAEEVIGRSLKSDDHIAELIAVGFAMFDEKERVEKSLVTALSSNNSPVIRRQLIHHYLRSGDPQKATPHVQQLMDVEGESAVDVAIVQAQVLQSNGLHHDVVSLLDDVRNRFPETRSDEVMRLRYASSQMPAAAAPIVSAGAASLKPPKSPRGILPALIFPALLLIGFGIYVGFCMFGSPRHAYLVNGLDRHYSVVINGTTVEVPAMTRIHIPASFGTTHIEPGSGAPSFDPLDLSIDPGFWGRPFFDDVHVVNPDGLAPIIWEEVGYVPQNAPSTFGDVALSSYISAGRLHYTFQDVDYVFETPPSQIEMSSSRSTTKKSHLYLDSNLTPEDVIAGLYRTRGVEEIAPYLKKIIDASPVSLKLWTVASATIPEQELMPLLEEKCAVRPIRIQAHRLWQSLTEVTSPDRDLAAEYKRLLDADPDNGDLAYLLARVTDDPKEAVALLQRAVSGPRPSGFGHFGLAYHCLDEGRFDEALQHARAAERSTQDDQVGRLTETALLAVRDIAGFETHVRNRAFGREIDTDAIIDLVRAIATHDREAANLQLTDAKRIATSTWGVPYSDPSIFDMYTRGNRAIVEAADGRDAYIRLLKSQKVPADKLEAALLEQDLDTVVRILNDDRDGKLKLGWTTNALGYILAMRSNRPDLAESFMTTMTSIYGNGDARMRKIADWLSGNEPPETDRLAHEMVPGSDAAVVLCVFAARFPSAAVRYLALARRHNFELAFPRILLDDLLANTDE